MASQKLENLLNRALSATVLYFNLSRMCRSFALFKPALWQVGRLIRYFVFPCLHKVKLLRPDIVRLRAIPFMI